MSVVRLTASSYQFSNTSYLSSSTISNAYTNIDSTTVAQINHTRSGTTAYYVYLRGFDFSQIPASATINSAIVKVKAYVSGYSAQRPVLYNGTSAISGVPTFSSTIGTSATTSTVDITSYWDTYKRYGSNFGVRFQIGRSSRNTASYLYIYGAEIYVDYTEAVPRTITTSATNCTINPSGTTTVYDGQSFTLNIDAPSQNVTVTDNGTDVTSQIHESPATGEVTSTPQSYTTSGSITGTYYQSAVGKDHNASSNTNNNYCSTSGSTAYIEYAFDTSDVPDGATIQSVVCKVKGHCESTSQSTEVSRIQLYSGSTAKGSSKDFTSTTDSVLEIGSDSTWTKAELNSAKLRYTIGYYGGNIAGASLIVTYGVEAQGYAYYYTIETVTEDHNIVVVCGESTQQLYVKESGSWVAYSKAYKKINGVWVEQSDLSSLFDTGTNYVKGN